MYVSYYFEIEKSGGCGKIKKKFYEKYSYFFPSTTSLHLMSAAALQNSCPEKFEDILWKAPVAEFLFPQPSKF